MGVKIGSVGELAGALVTLVAIWMVLLLDMKTKTGV
jgi:hypothetical protein